jgi:hypothetical protein
MATPTTVADNAHQTLCLGCIPDGQAQAGPSLCAGNWEERMTTLLMSVFGLLVVGIGSVLAFLALLPTPSKTAQRRAPARTSDAR